jgi:hypothetical protein
VKIFAGQTALRIEARTFCDLSGCVSAAIRFRRPDGSCGEFPAAVRDAERGVLAYECVKGDIGQAGWWSFWAFAEFDDGRSAAGESEDVFVWREGK